MTRSQEGGNTCTWWSYHMEMLALWSDKRKGCKRWRERGLAIRNGLQYEGQSSQGTVASYLLCWTRRLRGTYCNGIEDLGQTSTSNR